MSSSRSMPPGTVFARDFRIVRPLAEGGMGTVYVAEQLSTGKERALKLLLPQVAHDAKMRERFVQEARAASRIESDHVVEVVAAGVDEASAIPWLAMELLKGEELSKLLARRGWLEASEVLEIFRQLGHALGAAHRVGMVHRDLKPENIFLAAPRRSDVAFTVKLLDFGIAKLTQESKQGSFATGVLGTPLWMAPEQITASQIRPATDVWAMGLIAFAALSGRHYLREANGPNPSLGELLAEIDLGAIEPASVRAQSIGCPHPLPAGFDAWFARCVVRDPNARFANASDAVDALVAVLGPGARPAGVGLHPSSPTIASAPQPTSAVAYTSGMEFAGTLAASAPNTPPATNFAPPTLRHGSTPPPRIAAASTPAWTSPPTLATPRRSARAAALVAIVVVLLGIAAGAWFFTRDDGDDPAQHAGATPSSPAGPALHAGENWTGQYVCSGIASDLRLHITAVQPTEVDAVFEFRDLTTGATGRFYASGPYEPLTRRAQLRPGAWIVQPPGYIPVEVDLDVSANESTAAATLQYPTCAPFQLRRER